MQNVRVYLEDIGDLDTIMNDRSKNLILNYIHDDNHFINDFLNQLPSGRYRAIKYRSAWGRDCFLRTIITTLNDVFR